MRAILFLFLSVLGSTLAILSQEPAKSPISFPPTCISENAKTFWVCGPKGTLASSPNGDDWEIRNTPEIDNTLLSMGWANAKLGFAGGTGGTILLTADGGSSWRRFPTSFSEPVVNLSFSDEKHGIAQTTAAVLYTNDAGTKWQAVLPASSKELTKFKYVLKVAALDADHATVLVKEGPAQYYSSRLFSTADSGASWKVSDLEHTNLGNLLVLDGEYWLVGTEVIDRENRGGHAVPVTFHSRDAVKWERGPKPLIDVNDACHAGGCMMWNGAWFDPFHQNGDIHIFPAVPKLSTQWASVDNRMCTLTPELKCLNATMVKALPEQGGPAPPLTADELRPTKPDSEGRCIRCDYQRVLVSEKKTGKVSTQLRVISRADGTTNSVTIITTDDAEIAAELARAASFWIFYPVNKNGAPTPTQRTITLLVLAIKSPR